MLFSSHLLFKQNQSVFFRCKILIYIFHRQKIAYVISMILCGALVTLDTSTPATSADLQLQRVVNAFLDCMKNKSKPDIFAAKTREFQSLAATMFDAYPETSDVTIVAALVQLGVPQAVASNDVAIMLYKELPEEE